LKFTLNNLRNTGKNKNTDKESKRRRKKINTKGFQRYNLSIFKRYLTANVEGSQASDSFYPQQVCGGFYI